MYESLLVISLIVLPHSVRRMVPVLSVTTQWSNIGIVSAVFVVISLMCSRDIVTTPCIEVMVFSDREGMLQLLSQTNRLTDGVNNRLLRKTLAPDNPGEAGGVLSLTRSLNNELLDTKMLD